MKSTLQSVLESLSGSGPERGLVDLAALVLTVIVILVVFRIVRALILKIAGTQASPQLRFIIGRATSYTGVVDALMTVCNRLGVDLSAVLGAAGILGVAAGFAAQTSVSNIISGFFVMTERAFRIGDLLKVDSVSGVVESISLLSIRLRTPDNQLIRIPNETIIKTNLVNMSHFDNRRFDLRVSVSYGTDLRAVRELLLDIAKNNEFALQEPAPILIFDTLAPSAIEIMLGVWGKKENFLALKNSMMIDVTERFRTENVTVPYPRLDVAMKTSE